MNAHSWKITVSSVARLQLVSFKKNILPQNIYITTTYINIARKLPLNVQYVINAARGLSFQTRTSDDVAWDYGSCCLADENVSVPR